MTHSLLPLPSPADLNRWVAWDTGRPSEAPYQLSKARLKELRGIGHKLVEFLSARGRWWQHAAKASPADAPVWVGGLSTARPGEFHGEGFFACGLGLDREGFSVRHPALPG